MEDEYFQNGKRKRLTQEDSEILLDAFNQIQNQIMKKEMLWLRFLE